METVDFRHFPLCPGDTVLDLGCGEGRHVIAASLRADVRAVGVDLSLADLRSARDRFATVAGEDDSPPVLAAADALRLPFADDSFDKVICSEVLEHIPDWQGALVEIERVLKPGGLFCASVPRFWPEWLCWQLSDAYHANEGGHIRIFRAGELRDAIERRGFRFLRRHWAHALHAPFWWLRCLMWDRQDRSRLVSWYHRLLVWDLMSRPWLTRTLERVLNPVMGKSVVMYFRKEASA